MLICFSSIQEYFKTLGTLLTISLFLILVSKDVREELINVWKVCK
ncbi:hypothetical protein [Clostridium aciditolerans]|nr:hypothetical protein [Clostridium aciditolerans]